MFENTNKPVLATCAESMPQGGRPGPSTQPLAPSRADRPARPLVREHTQIITPEYSSPESAHEDVNVPEEHLSPIEERASPTQEVASPIIPEELYPTRRLSTPSDTYSSGPSREPSLAPRSPRSDPSGVPPSKPRIEFVYPPRPRSRANGLQDEDEVREFSPGPPWLEKMVADLQRGRKELLKCLGETKKDAQDALYDLTATRALLDKEQAAFKACVEGLRVILGDKLVADLCAEGVQAAEERTSDEEEEDEDGEQKRNSEEHSGDDDDDGEDGRRSDGRKFESTSSKKRGSDNAEPQRAAKESTHEFQFQPQVLLLDGPASSQPRLKRTFTAFNDEEADEWADADDEGTPSKSDAGPSRKRTRVSPSSRPKSGRTREPPSSPVSVPPIATLATPSPASPSRKRGRTDDDDESEQEVERSIRVSTSPEAGLLAHGNKRLRSDVAATSPEALDAASMSSDKLALVPYVPPQDSSSGPGGRVHTSDKDGTPFVLCEYGSEEDDHESYLPSDDEDYDTLASDVTEDEIVVDDDRASSNWDSDDSHSNSGAKSKQSLYYTIDEGKGTWLWDAATSPSLDVGFQTDLGPLDSVSPRPKDVLPPHRRLLGFRRPVVRARERIRPTPDGGVEVYKFDEGPEYEARLAREAEFFAEWRKFKPQSSGYRARESLREFKGRSVADGEDGEEM